MYRWTRNILYAVLIALVIYVAIIFSTQDDVNGPDLGLLLLIFIGGPAALFAMFVFFGEAGVFEPRRRAWLVLGYLEQAVRMNLPLPRLLISAEKSERGAVAWQLKRLRKKLEAGSSISDAIRQAVPLVPPRTIALLSASETSGRIGDELGRAMHEHNAVSAADPADDSFLRIYPVIMILITFCVVSMIMIFVIPKFMQIFADFRTPLPATTRMLIHFSDGLMFDGWILPILLLAVLFPILRRTRWVRQIQLLAWLPRNRNLSDICHVIANSLESSLPLPIALRSASKLSVGKQLKKKLTRWADGVEGGMPSAHAANVAGMPRLISAMTATTDLTAAADAFRFLSRYYAVKFSRLMTLLRAAAIPAMTLFFGGIVGFVVISLFLPPISLINAVNPYRGMP